MAAIQAADWPLMQIPQCFCCECREELCDVRIHLNPVNVHCLIRVFFLCRINKWLVTVGYTKLLFIM